MTHPFILEAHRIGSERSRRAAAYTGPALPFTHLGNNREADMPWLSHEKAAGTVRMLMRDQLDHEAICCMARDRILHLAQENERMKAALLVGLDAVTESFHRAESRDDHMLAEARHRQISEALGNGGLKPPPIASDLPSTAAELKGS